MSVPELMALKRLSTSCATGLMPESVELLLPAADEAVVEEDAEVLGVA